MKDTDFVEGNTEDKYNTKNPISKVLVGGFIHNFTFLLDEVEEPADILEIGAGEGFLTTIVAKKFPQAQIKACDLSAKQVDLARTNLASFGSRISVSKEDAENLSLSDQSINFVICCEVLEHVEKPLQALSEIRRILRPGGHALVSVPWEPLWRVLNMARGKYVSEFGNTPGHLNHFSRRGFVKMVTGAGFDLVAQKHPFPWSMILVKVRS